MLVAAAVGVIPTPNRRILVPTAVGVLVFFVAAVLMSRPYLRVIDEHPEARRTPAYVESFSPQLRSFLAAPAQSWLWAGPSLRARAPLAAPDEMSLFPGLAISLLALLGVVGSVFTRRLRIGIAAGVVVCAALSLGVRDVSGLNRYLDPVPIPIRLRARLGRRAHPGTNQHAHVVGTRPACRGGSMRPCALPSRSDRNPYRGRGRRSRSHRCDPRRGSGYPLAPAWSLHHRQQSDSR